MEPKVKSPVTGTMWAKNNLIAVLDNPLNTYIEEIQLMVKILKNSFLNTPLTNTSSDVPEAYIIKASESSSYDAETKIIPFKLHDDSQGYIDRDLFVLVIGITDVFPLL